MSNTYTIYTEVQIKGKWICINGMAADPWSLDKQRLIPTYWSGSRSYFGETYQKLHELGAYITPKELSSELCNKFAGNEGEPYYPLIAVNSEELKKIIPNTTKIEYHGFVEKDLIFSFEADEAEEIYDSLRAEEYQALDDETKKAYAYYEWDDPMGWFYHIKKILAIVEWQIINWSDMAYDNPNSRIIVEMN